MEFLTTRQAADRLGRSVATVHRHVDAGRLTPVMRGEGIRGPMWFSLDDIDAFAAAVTEAAGAVSYPEDRAS